MSHNIEKPVWIVAVSGGVDSMVLLHKLIQEQAAALIVAHVDHGIRPESALDAHHVESTARQYGLQFELGQFSLGNGASEEQARQVRYTWLESIRQKYNAEAIVTAHHQDDVFETIMINLERGTGWRGITSLRSLPFLLRPFLSYSKAEIVRYAIDHNIVWVEDDTNQNARYLRNALRQLAIPRLNPAQRQRLQTIYERQLKFREEIDREVAVAQETAQTEHGLSRYHIIMWPREVSLEVLRAYTQRTLTRIQLRKLIDFTRTAKSGAKLILGKDYEARVTRDELIVYPLKTC